MKTLYCETCGQEAIHIEEHIISARLLCCTCNSQQVFSDQLAERFKMYQEVTIVPLGIKGHIDGIMEQCNETEYHVVYWWEGERLHEWVYSWEIA